MKLVKIVKCRDKLMWYAHLIGYSWYVQSEDATTYTVRDNENYLNIIHKTDAEEQVVK